MKKLFSMVLVVAMVLLLFPVSVFAAPIVVTDAAELTSVLDAGGEIELGADIDAGEMDAGAFFTVAEGKTVTLDLNGHTLEGTFTGAGDKHIIYVYRGTLTIKDSAGGGKIMINSTFNDGMNYACAVVANYGSLTIESGALINEGGTDMAYAVDNRSNDPDVHADFTMTGGELISEYIGLRLYANITQDDACKATIKGGSIYGKECGIWIQQPTPDSNTEAVLKIKGGKVEAEELAAVMADLGGNDGVDIFISGGELVNHSDGTATLALNKIRDNSGGANVEISGGEFLNTGTGGNLSRQDDTSVIAVSKGTFSAAVPSEFIAEGADPGDIILQSDSVVAAKADIAYTIVITPSVNFGKINRDMGTQSKPFVVAVENALIDDEAVITVRNTTADMRMKDKGGVGNETLAFTLTQPDGVFTFTQNDLEDGEESITSSVSCEPSELKAAGLYKGYMTFEVSYSSN